MKVNHKYWDIVLANQGLIGNVITRNFLWMLDRSKCVVFDYKDIFHIGLLGLYKAVTLFDESKGFKLSTYSFAWIYQSIMRSFHEEGFRTVRVPVHTHEALCKYIKEHGQVDVDTLYAQGKITKYQEWALRVLLNQNFDVPLDLTLEDADISDHHITYGDVIQATKDKRTIECLEDMMVQGVIYKMCESVAKSMKSNGERNKSILYMRYGLLTRDFKTLEQVAQEFSITRERVRQIEQNMFKSMREYFKENTILFSDLIKNERS